MKTKILIVDDDQSLRECVGMLLTGGGYEVLTAEDGLVATRMLEVHEDVAFVLTDTQMPNMDGIALVGWMKENRPHIPVVITTGNPVTADKAVTCGAAGFIPKPFSPENILGIIQRLVPAPAEVSG